MNKKESEAIILFFKHADVNSLEAKLSLVGCRMWMLTLRGTIGPSNVELNLSGVNQEEVLSLLTSEVKELWYRNPIDIHI